MGHVEQRRCLPGVLVFLQSADELHGQFPAGKVDELTAQFGVQSV
nr:hypothetical protein [Tessaracoccus massiliensis]